MFKIETIEINYETNKAMWALRKELKEALEKNSWSMATTRDINNSQIIGTQQGGDF